jgi:ABC-type transport system substrate-binding protein
LEKPTGKKIKDLPELEIVSAFNTPRVEQEMAMIKEFWSGLGIKVRLKYITDWDKFETYLRSDAVQLYRYAWSADMPDPDSFLYSLFASESPTNFMKLKDKNVDQMLLAARGLVDPVERATIYQKIEASVMASAPLIPLFYMSVDRVYQPYVKSVTVSALGAHAMPLNRIWLDKTAQNK